MKAYHLRYEKKIRKFLSATSDVKNNDDKDNVNAIVDTKRGNTLLIIASRHDDVDAVRDLLQRGANVNQGNNDGATPLYVASHYGHLSIVELLLEHDADVNQSTTYGGRSPLFAACRRGNDKVVETLVQRGNAEVNVTTNAGDTPLSIACYYDHKYIVKILLNNGAYANGNDDDVSTIKKKCRSIMDGDVKRPLHIACRRGYLHITKLLLRYGANINQQTKSNHRNANAKTPLWLASIHGHDSVVELLLKKGANIHVSSKGIMNGSSVTTPHDRNTMNAAAAAPLLFMACRRGRLGIVNAILERMRKEGGVGDVNLLAPEVREDKFYSCNTTAPLLIAVSREQVSLVEALLFTHNADPSIMQDDCQKAIDIARRNGYNDIVRLLMKERLHRKRNQR